MIWWWLDKVWIQLYIKTSTLHYCILQLHKASMYTNVKNDNRTLQKNQNLQILFHFYYVDINLEPVKISVMCFGKKVDHFLLSRKLAQFENCHSSLFFMFISWFLGVENGVHKNICKAQHKSAAYFREEITSTDKT